MDKGLSSKNRLILVRVLCAVFAVLTVLLLSTFDPVRELPGKIQSAVGGNLFFIPLLFWVALFLIVHGIVSAVAKSIWLDSAKEKVDRGYIRKRDLSITPSAGIDSIARYRVRLKEMMASSQHSAVDIVNSIIGFGFSVGASDIHISPDPDKVSVVFRVHGTLYPIGEITHDMYPQILRRMKIVSGLPIYGHGTPQDGHINFDDRAYTARVAVFPTSCGDRLALRLANVHAAIMDIDKIGMPQDILLDYKALLNRNQGMIVITGPTGSGKSTTMFSSLLHIQKLRRGSVNIVTLEDPIETNLEGFLQTQVGQNTGLSFSSGLRSVLRQDPDVIMLGEIRDEETASIAVRAAMTGHLLLTTVHASSTAGVFNRMSQMGIEPSDLSSSIHAVISQRLCQRLCPDCRHEIQLSQEHMRQLKLIGVEEMPTGPFYESGGCHRCLGLGFTGRVALFEMLLVTDHLRDLISAGCASYELRRAAIDGGMRSILDHGLELARDGVISMMELTRVVSE